MFLRFVASMASWSFCSIFLSWCFPLASLARRTLSLRYLISFFLMRYSSSVMPRCFNFWSRIVRFLARTPAAIFALSALDRRFPKFHGLFPLLAWEMRLLLRFVWAYPPFSVLRVYVGLASSFSSITKTFFFLFFRFQRGCSALTTSGSSCSILALSPESASDFETTRGFLFLLPLLPVPLPLPLPVRPESTSESCSCLILDSDSSCSESESPFSGTNSSSLVSFPVSSMSFFARPLRSRTLRRGILPVCSYVSQAF
mmetsp:Transcript_12098/g.34663  ORF Transcript_12098/g.34663 Transcript_12098/m.34663 type:complete len:257 (+) Transcript_12098:896-1666(+)